MPPSIYSQPYSKKLPLSDSLLSTFRLLFFALLFLFQTMQVAFALEVPNYQGYVNDYADLISINMENSLEEVLDNFDRTESAQIAVLTIDTLQGDSLEEYALRVATQWEIGETSKSAGVLFLVAKRERKVRIEVVYSSKGGISDAAAGQVIGGSISPLFKLGHFDQGFQAGVNAIIQAIKDEIGSKISSSERKDNNSLDDAKSAYRAGDYATALRLLSPLAEQGDAPAQYNLGVMHENGQGVPQDYKAAIRWYKAAAEQGGANYQYNLAVKFYKGEGLPQDYTQADYWCSKAAEQGHVGALYNLEYMTDKAEYSKQPVLDLSKRNTELNYDSGKINLSREKASTLIKLNFNSLVTRKLNIGNPVHWNLHNYWGHESYKHAQESGLIKYRRGESKNKYHSIARLLAILSG